MFHDPVSDGKSRPASFPVAVFGIVARQSRRKPAVGREVNSALAQTAAANLDTFLRESGFLSCRAAVSTSRLQTRAPLDLCFATYRTLIVPLELITRCHGTVSLL